MSASDSRPQVEPGGSAGSSQEVKGGGGPLAAPTPTEPPPDHRLVLNGDPRYGWELRCVHPHGDSRWVSTTEDGEVDSSDCWVQSWWGEVGLDLVDYDADGWPLMAVSLPVVVDGDGWSDPPAIGPYVRPQVEPGGGSPADGSQGTEGDGEVAAPVPTIDSAGFPPPCPTCGAQPGGCEHVTVHQRGESAKPGGVVLRRTVVTITYPWEDA